MAAFREAGLSYREIAYRVDRSATTIVRICQIWEEERRGIRRRPTGNPRLTTTRQDRRLRLSSLRDRFSTSWQIGDHWFTEEGRPVSMTTISGVSKRSDKLFSTY
jgi:transposase